MPASDGNVVVSDAREVGEEVLAVGEGGCGVIGVVVVYRWVADEALGAGGGKGKEKDEGKEEEEREVETEDEERAKEVE